MSKKIGITFSTFDLLHAGHIAMLEEAKSKCDYLIVGVTSDELVSYKNKKSVIPFEERIEIIKSIKYVDRVVVQDSMNKIKAWHKLKFNIMFVGSDWKGTDKWNEFEKEFKPLGVKIIYFQYTKNTSSTLLKEVLKKL